LPPIQRHRLSKNARNHPNPSTAKYSFCFISVGYDFAKSSSMRANLKNPHSKNPCRLDKVVVTFNDLTSSPDSQHQKEIRAWELAMENFFDKRF